jgi:putative membrane protein
MVDTTFLVGSNPPSNKESEDTVMMWPSMMWGFGWGDLFLTLLGLALLVLFVWAVIRLVQGKTLPLPPSASVPPTGPSALDILNQRYARGEIDAMTYEQMRARLEASPERQPTGRV